MDAVREAAVAGQFYPGKAAQLKHVVDNLLQEVATDAPCPKAVVAPHAGYIYSGPIAAQAYARVGNGAQQISRVILLGPSHRVGFSGIATSSAEFYVSPLGRVPLDLAATREINRLPGVAVLDEAHAREHSLEVHLPFLQRCLQSFSLVPLVVGQAEAADVARVLDTLWGGPETLIVVSSDLSHFLRYPEAQKQDAETSRLIEARHTHISGEQACGCRPLNGLLQVLRQRDLNISTLAVNNSGDTAGDKERVVGYGAYVVEAPVARKPAGVADESAAESSSLNTSQRQQLLHLARNTILRRLRGERELQVPLEQYHPELQRQMASFVTLNRHGKLRGCVGNLAASRALVEDVAHNAAAAAFKDPRFEPVTLTEYAELELHISVLSEPRRLPVTSRQDLLERLRPGVDGVILQQGGHRATYLPSVWEQLSDPEQFVSELRRKAGLPREGWSAEMQVSIYTTCEFS